MEHQKLHQFIHKVLEQADDVLAINLSTVDGFTIINHTADGVTIDGDKLSAVSSSLQSLSQAATQQLMKSQLNNTIIESEAGNMILLSTTYLAKKAVLCFISGSGLNVAKSRYFAVQLAQLIANIEE
jgi:predicted regulator of Ras-like GTPase activity (Roadblock/LC7/MglB family)